MTDEDVNKRIAQLLDPIWTFNEVKKWYGIDVGAAPQSFLAQYRIWVDRYRKGESSSIKVDGHLNRFYLELFLQHRGLIGPRAAAYSLGMSEDSFRKTLTEGIKKNFFSEAEANGEFPVAHVFRASFVSDIYQRFGNLADRIFTTYSSFCKVLHQAIEAEIGVKIEPVYCATSIKLGEDPPDFANLFDIITGEPMGIRFQVWIDTPKPIQLKPDACSWLTCAKHEETLKPHTDLESDTEFQKNKHALQR